MRKIKFKVWDFKNNKWHNDEGGYAADTEWIGINELITFTQEREFRICQYTGLKDKNGKEIYEGDIIKDAMQSTWSVDWDNENAVWNITRDEGGEPWIIEKFEVVGNIYENKDLIK